MRVQIKEKLEKLKRLIVKTKKNPNRKNIHLLRIELKTWKAFCDFTHAYAGTSKKQVVFPVQFQKLFSALGKYRATQIQLTTLSDFKKQNIRSKKFKLYLKKRKSNFYQRLKKIIIKTSLFSFTPYQEKFFKTMRQTSQKKIEKQLELFISNLFKKVFLTQSDKIRSLHLTRIQLKKITLLIGRFNLPNVRKKIQPIFKGLNKFEKQLGHWHDFYVMKNRLQKFLLSCPKKMKEKKFMVLRKTITQRETDLRSTTKHSMQQLIPFVKKVILSFHE